ncbi:unnamed protein product [Microthlaspi erraticum]|uniref:Arabidopsis retrotransposon Orf1 C-terminal domain-containing protein n=1 Tax=Microthlaspi erraticum TaxID=1685480 RepID=A0A6D2KDV6_9BRAS|nr:unnamed protein product [Microthlaspi erraticum]
MSPWKAEPQEEEDELPMYQEHYNALFSMDFVETKYPHDDTMRALGIFEDVELVLKNMHWQSSSLTAWSHTRSSLEDGNLQAARDTLWFTYGEGNLWDIKEDDSKESPVLRYVHKALANTFFARKATGTINEGEVKLLDMGIKPIISRTRDGKKIRGDRAHAGNLMPLLEQLLSYKTRLQHSTSNGKEA